MLFRRFPIEVAVALLKPRLLSRCLFPLALLVSSLGAHEGKASHIPGLPVPGRPWAALLIEDHKGMQEVVWDAAFNDLQAAGPFVKNHSYVISTSSKPRLLDLGCWDASQSRGSECHDMASPATLAWTADHKGVVLKAGTHATWLPALGGFDGDELPNTFRGAYLNWLLTHRPTTPAIPKETRWQRVQRGATSIATQLFSQGGGKPAVRLVGIGTSGHLLIPPGESLSQLLQSIRRMHPQSHDGEGGHGRDDHRDRDGDRDDDCDRDGSMLKALQRAYAAVSFHGSDHDCDHDCDHQDHRDHGHEHHDRDCDHRDHRDHGKDHPGHDCDHQDHREHGKEHHGHDCDHRDHRDHDCGHPAGSCMPNVVFPISDGVAFGTNCGSARPYEALAQYNDMLKVVADIAATGQGVVWPWNVEGPAAWDQDLATKGKGQPFEGDAVAAMGAAFKAWMSASGSAPAVTLKFSTPDLTRVPATILTVSLSSPATSATLNGQPLALTGLSTAVPLVLNEGVNTFTVAIQSACGNSQASISVVLDTHAPLITIQSPAEGLRTNAPSVTLTGTVDDPAAAMTVNGLSVPQTNGAFTATFTPAEGPFSMTVVAKDLAGNSSTATRSIVIDRTAPRITLTSSVPTLTSAASLALQGQVDDPSAVLTVNGQAVALNAQGGFSVTLPLTEGTNPFHFVAMDLAGNAGTLEVSTTRDSIAPVVTISSPAEGWRTNAATVTLTGSVDDPTATLTVNGQPLSQSNGSFSTSLNPAEGSFAMNVLAKDAAGNTGTALRTIIVDRTAPRISLSKPVPALVGAVTLSIQGLVDDPSARLTINGAAAVLDAQGAFMADVPLSEGANTIHLEATDLTGNVGVLDAKTLRDTTPPVVTLDSPMDGLVTNQHSILVKGRVDDPTARLLVAGQSLSPAADGSFEVTLSPSEGSQLVVVLATDQAGNTGHAVRNVTLDWTPPTLAWAAPTPVEGAKVTSAPVAVFATVSESATVLLNGQTLTLENGAPYTTKTTLSPGEGPVTLRLEATDRAGNKASIERHFDLGQTAPLVSIESPAEGLQTQDSAAVLVGHVDCGDFLKPLTLTLNGATVSVGPDGRFSLPVQLTEGANAFKLVATNAFGLQGQAARTLNRFTTPFGIQLDWPLEGLALPATSVEVRGRVLRPGTNVAVNGTPGPVDATSLRFAVVVPLQPGLNTLTANATDAAGNQGQALVHVTSAPPVAATYRWDLPANGGASHSRVVHIQGQADLPGITSVRINGQAMSLTGTGRDGQFAGDITFEAKGRNALYLEARTLTGAALNERRDVSFVPELPRVRLQAPETARPGDTIPIQVSPETGTRLTNADISWNGRFLVRVTDSFAPVTAQVPADAVVGSRIPIEVLATDAEGEQVTARTTVTIYGQGALLVEAYDDAQGLPLKEGQALVEGGEAQTLDATGKAALRTALPQNWIKVSRSGFTPVWRPASLQVGGVQAVVDARLTPLAVNQPITVGAFTGQFGKGALSVAFPAGAFQTEGTLSVTPLSTQGLPGLLPSGWSAVSAWWLDTGGVLPASAGTAALTLPAGAPQDNLTWVRWDEGLHAWVTLGTGLHASNLSGLAMASPGGFALVVPDAGLTAPPAAIANAQLPTYEGVAWRDGLVASGSVDPATLATTAAIHGARATAKFALDFNGKDPLPSGSVIQVDVLESYALLDSAVIEPDGFTQDAVLSRWLLGVDSEGAPTLKAARDLGLELPVRMSRTFQENELVDGHIWVGFYHDGIQVAQNGSELLDASGGTITQDGMQLTIPVQALTGTTLIRLNADQGDPASLWPELAGQGTLAKSFQLDIVGTVQQGLQLRFDNLGQVPQGILPLLVQRRVVQGERVLVAVGELDAANSGWVLQTPMGGAPLLTGGAFAVLVPNQAWNWISGQATVPASVAQPLVQRLGEKAHLVSARQAQNQASLKKITQPRATPRVVGSTSQGSATDDFAVADAMVDAGYLKAVSAGDGSFAVPSFLPSGSPLVTVKGERRDLGVWGSIDASVPSTGQVLRLAQVPFKVLTITPSELTEVGVGTVMEVQLTTAADPSTVSQVRVFQEVVPSPYLVPAPSVALATISTSTKANALPGSATPSTASKSKAAATVKSPGLKAKKGALAKAVTPSAKKRSTAKPTSPSEKKALQAVDAPQLVEVSVRRTLSLDGRTLQLTPDAALQPGAVYRVVTTGLASVSNEVAPTYTRRFKTLAQPQFPDVDFSRLKLSYPTAAFDVTVTIPEGSVPPWSIVSVEAPDMGSFGQGVMPPTGDLVFALKANLGERLRVMVQIRDGRSIGGSIGRYVADDGRTTLGVDGGRVEGPGGLAIVVPAGALDNAAELRVVASTDTPLPAEGSLLNGEQMAAALELRSKDPISFKKPPVLELPLSSVPAGMMTTVDPADTFGNGPVPIYQKVATKLPDGTDDFSYVLIDTAKLSSDGQKLQSAGGLQVPDLTLGSVVQTQPVKMSLRSAAPAKSAAQPQFAKAGTSTKGVAATSPGADYIDYEPYSVGFFTMFIPIAVIEPKFMYQSGTVYRNWNGSGRCGGSASATCYGELASAEVHRYNGTLGLDAARKGRLSSGRMLTTCDAQGRYLNVGGPITGAIPGQTWIALFAVDPRTGETSIDPNSPSPTDLGLPWERRNHSLAITSSGGNPFDPTLTAPRIRAQMVDATGVARTMFAVGETATLKITTDTGSQSVVRGKVSGSITQDFGALPADIAVTFSQEGTWKADLLGWSAKPVQGAASLSVIVTPAGVLGPALPGKPTIISRNPGDGDKDVDPSTIVKITFSEPVRGATATAFILEVNNTKVPFRVIANAREVLDASTLVQEVWLVPDQRLTLGASAKVSLWSSVLADQEGLSPDPASWTFTVRGADEVGSLAGVGTFSQMVVHKGKIYTAEDVGTGYYFDGNAFVNDEGMRKQGIRVIDATDPSHPSLGPIFGEYRSWNPPTPEFNNLGLYQGPFAKSSISGMRVAAGVNIGGKTRDLLLVATRPWSVQEIVMLGFISYDEYYPTIYHIRHNALWVFDITGDADSMEVSMGSTVPKLLMSTSQGTMSDNWVKGIGSAGGVLGSIKLRGGFSAWDADKWKGSWDADQGTLSDWTIRYRTAGATGYNPDPQSLVASNGFYNATLNSQPTVTSAVVTEDANGRPIGFATMGYATGYLMAIDGKVGEPMALATFSAGGPHSMDSRLHDLSPTVNNELANAVEVVKGSWSGPGGTEQGTLLLAATSVGTNAHLWVLNADLTDMTHPTAAQYALATLPGRITRIIPDAARMLVGVEAGGKVYFYDLKNLQPTVATSGTTPMTLTPIYDCAVSEAWTLSNGLLFIEGGAYPLRLAVRNLDGVQIDGMSGIPVITEISPALAGAFYRYNAKVLGNPNPPAPDQPPSELVYAITDLYKKNSGLPWLRYYYPDLGEMYVTGSLRPADPNQQTEMLKPDSSWFVEAIGTLLDGNQEIRGVVDVRGLNVVAGKFIGESSTNRIRVQEVSYTESFGSESVRHTLDYTPFKFKIAQDWLNSHDQLLRTDEHERFRVRIRMRLFKDENDRAHDVEKGSKTLEFSVKFNTNTRLFDIARGGVWYFDPNVSGDDPFDTGKNPFTDQWYGALAQQGFGDVEVQTALQTRLSLTPGQLLEKGAAIGDGTVVQDQAVSYDFQNLGLDLIQAMLDRALVPLRRQVFRDGTNFRSVPMPMSYRSTFLQASDDLIQGLRAKGDVPGAFGHRTAHALNAVQAFSQAEAGDTGQRDLNRADLWQSDPAVAPTDKVLGGWASIMPVIRQQLKDKNGKAYVGNSLIHYLVAYPRVREQGTSVNGLYAVNTILTRDLIFGPTPFPWDGMDKLAVDGRSFLGQRKAIDDLLQQINGLPGKADPAYDETKARDLFQGIQKEILAQDIIVDKGSAIFRNSGQFFNPGVGILQLGLQDNWLRRRGDDSTTSPGYVPNNNAHVLVLSDPVPNLPSNQLTSTLEWATIKKRVINFLIDHPNARRVDLYINGVQNVALELEDSADRLQRHLVSQEFTDPLGHGEEVPLVAVYNTSSKLYYGGSSRRILDTFDWDDILTQKNDAACPDRPTSNPDSLRLIAALRAVVESVCADKGFKDAFLTAHSKDPDALKTLESLRNRITLHTHSQGAIAASVAQTRLGDFSIPHPTDYPTYESIAKRVDLVSYGGGANMLDWGSTSYFKSYLHQANGKDAIAAVTGMGDPFQALIRSMALNVSQAPGGQVVGIPLSGLLLINASGRNILKGPSEQVKAAYATYHKVIHHSSPCSSLNVAEHNFSNGYLCHVGQDPAFLTLWPTHPFLNEWDGGPGCLPFIDCER